MLTVRCEVVMYRDLKVDPVAAASGWKEKKAVGNDEVTQNRDERIFSALDRLTVVVQQAASDAVAAKNEAIAARQAAEVAGVEAKAAKDASVESERHVGRVGRLNAALVVAAFLGVIITGVSAWASYNHPMVVNINNPAASVDAGER